MPKHVQYPANAEGYENDYVVFSNTLNSDAPGIFFNVLRKKDDEHLGYIGWYDHLDQYGFLKSQIDTAIIKDELLVIAIQVEILNQLRPKQNTNH